MNGSTVQLRIVLAIFAWLAIVTGGREAAAEKKTFIRDYTYQASEVDSKVSSRTVSLEQLKRLLLEEVGTYVQSETVVKDYRLTKDQIVTLTAGIVNVEILDEKWNGASYYIKAQISLNPEEVAQSVDSLRKNNAEQAELEESRRQMTAALNEVEKLRRELELIKPDKNQQPAKPAEEIQQKEKAFARGVEELRVNGLLQNAAALMQSGQFEAASAVFNDVLKADPGDKRAYLGRGAAYARQKKSEEALKDFNKALEIDPNFAKAYMARGKMLRFQEKYVDAVRELDKALKLKPDLAEAYFERGMAMIKSGNRPQGREDIRTSARLGFPKADQWLRERQYRR